MNEMNKNIMESNYGNIITSKFRRVETSEANQKENTYKYSSSSTEYDVNQYY